MVSLYAQVASHLLGGHTIGNIMSSTLMLSVVKPSPDDCERQDTKTDGKIAEIDLDIERLSIKDFSPNPFLARPQTRRRSMERPQRTPRKFRRLTATTKGEQASLPSCQFTFTVPGDYEKRWFELSSAPRFLVAEQPQRHWTVSSRAKRDEVMSRPLRDASLMTKSFDAFRFMDLPRELRDIIYGFTLAADENARIFLSLDKRTKAPRIARLPYPAFSLLSVSRQLREEATPVLYESSHFYMRSIRHLPHILTKLGTDPLQHMRWLEVDFWGLKSRQELFRHLDEIQQLRRLAELRVNLDYFTIKAIKEHLMDYDAEPFCAHHTFTDTASYDDYIKLFDCIHLRRDKIPLQLLFDTHPDWKVATPKRKHLNQSISSCISCAILTGLKQYKRAHDPKLSLEERAKAPAADAPIYVSRSLLPEKTITTTPWLIFSPEPRTYKT